MYADLPRVNEFLNMHKIQEPCQYNKQENSNDPRARLPVGLIMLPIIVYFYETSPLRPFINIFQKKLKYIQCVHPTSKFYALCYIL